MRAANHLDPHAPGVVKMRRERAYRAAWRAGNGLRPKLGRQVLDEIRGDAIVRAPRRN